MLYFIDLVEGKRHTFLVALGREPLDRLILTSLILAGNEVEGSNK